MRDLRAASPAIVRVPALAAGVALGLALAACASDPGPRGPGGPGPRGPGPGLFVSPFGEVFRAEPGAPWPVAAWFAGADADHDGALTFNEFTADGRRWFAVLDLDHSGRLEPGEIAAYEARLDGPGDGGGDGVGRIGGRERPGGRRLGLAGPPQQALSAPRRTPDARMPRSYGRIAEAGFFNLPQPIKAADVNVDQRITAQEWARMTERWFQVLDSDHDGRLTLETLPRTPLQARADR